MADDLPLPPWAHSHDAALYRGDFIQVMHLKQEESIQVLCDAPNPMTNDIHAMSRTRASAAVSARLVLRAASLLEGWGVLLSRWVLEAAATGNAQPGSADAFFESCRPALNPSAKQLLAAVHATGHVSRFNVSRAIGQCAAHQDLWATLGARTATATFGHGAAVATSNGIDEHTRLYWTPLHFAAAFGSIDVVEGLLALHPRNVSIANGAGFSPLHVAVSHDAIGPAATLASLPFTTDVVDNVGRTPAALALEVLPSVSRCRAMLAALNEVATGALTRQARRECARAASYRKERNAQVRRVPPRHLPLACANGGGWASEDGNDATCGTDALPRGGTVSDDGDDDVDDDDDSDGGGSDGGGSGGGGRRREQHTRSKEKRRCDIPIAEDVNAADLIHEFLVSGSPILVTNGASASELYSRWRMPSFVHAHGGVTVSPEPYPYAHASAALYGVPTDNSTTVAQLLASDDAHGLLRHGVFNALHGWHRIPYHGDGTEVRSRHGDITLDAKAATRLPPTSPTQLLHDFERPPFLEDEQWLLRTNTIQFYLGDRSSGAQPHWHSAAWNWLVHGRKRWFLWPPSDALYSQRHVEHTVGPQQRTAGADAAGAATTAAATSAKPKRARPPAFVGKPLQCDQRPGEVIVIPELWGHATVNLARSIGWASEFHFDRAMDDGLSATHGSEWWRVGERPVEDSGDSAIDKVNLVETRPMGVYGTRRTMKDEP